jgi:hypothetical protein
MTGNDDFPTPPAALTELATACVDLESAITAAKDGGRTATAAKRRQVNVVIQVLRILAGNVTTAARGDEMVIRNSGFDVKRTSTPAGELPTPTDLQALISPHRGRIDLTWKSVRGSRLYSVFQSSSELLDEASWVLIGHSTRARYSVTGLNSAKTYWFRVAAIGTLGASPVSDPAQCMSL